MKYLKQLLIILGFSLLGQLLHTLIPIPIPAAIYGLILLFIALCTGLLKQEHIAATADFLVGIMPVLFVAPAVNLLAYTHIIAPDLVPVVVITVVSTFVVFAVSGLVTQWLLKKEENSDG